MFAAVEHITTSQPLTDIGYIALLIVIGKIAGALCSIFGLGFGISRLKPFRVLWQRNVSKPVQERRARIFGEVAEHHLAPIKTSLAEAAAAASTAVDVAREANAKFTRLYEIIDRELSPDHGEALVDKVDYLVSLHGAYGSDHPHKHTIRP